MTTQKELLEATEKYIAAKELELAAKQIEVLDFVDTDHKAKATQNYLKELRKIEKDVHKTLLPLLQIRQGISEFNITAAVLCERSKEVKEYIKNMDKRLSDDLIQKQHDEAVDLMKDFGFMAAMAVAAVNVAKSTVDPHSVHGTLEATAGASFGVCVIFYKKIGNSCKLAARAICASPQKAKDSFMLYYVKESSKEVVLALLKPVINQKSLVINGEPRRNGKNERKEQKQLKVS